MGHTTSNETRPSPIVKTPGVASLERRPYFASIDGIRGLLALLIAVYHANWHNYLIYESFLGEAFVLIDLFFIFSGFLMFRLYGDKIKDGVAAKSFMLKRFIRLYPLHIFTFGLFFALNVLRMWGYKSGVISFDPGDTMPFADGSPDNIVTAISHVFMTHALGLHNGLSFNWPSWTISAEFFVYIVFIGIMLYLRPVKKWHFFMLALYSAGIFGYIAIVSDTMDVTYDYGFFRCLAGFLVGLVISRIFMSYEKKTDMLSFNAWTALEVITVALYVGFLYFARGKWAFFHAPFSALMVFIFAFDGGRIAKLLSNRVLKYLAKISFTIYLLHAFIAVVFEIFAKKAFDVTLSNDDSAVVFSEAWMGEAYMVVYLISVIVASHFVYKYVEDGCARYLKAKWIDPKTKASEVKPSAAKA